MKLFIYTAYLITVLFVSNTCAQTIVQKQKVFASDRENREHFGYHVQIFEDFAFISAKTEGTRVGKGGSQEGAVYVFAKDSTGQWYEHQKLVGSNRSGDDNFGSAIERSGNLVIIGADKFGDDDHGAAYMFELAGQEWVEVTRLEASIQEKNGAFGVDVGIAGDYAVIGAYGDSKGLKDDVPLKQAGKAYLFKRDSSSGRWTEHTQFVSPRREKLGRFGHNVYMTDKYMAISAINENIYSANAEPLKSVGMVYLYELDDSGKWQIKQQITHSDSYQYDFFGDEVIISGKDLFISTQNKHIGDKKMAGAVYYFEKQEDGQWLEKQKIISPDRAHRDLFGYSVAVRNDILLVSGDWRDLSGAGYVFVKNECGTWTFAQKITAQGEPEGKHSKDSFGGWVSLSDEHMLFGAIYDHNATGKEDLFEAGSAFIFDYAGFETIDRPCNSSNRDLPFVDSSGFDNLQPITVLYEEPAIDSTEVPVVEDSVIIIEDEEEVTDSLDIDDINEEEEGQEDLQETRFIISPITNKGRFQIEVLGPMNGPYKVSITTPFGRIFKELTLVERITYVDLGRRAKGSYVVKIFADDGTQNFWIFVEDSNGRE